MLITNPAVNGRVYLRLNRHPSATKIIISQRASSVKNADLIAVIEDGALVAAGTHTDLLDLCPVYGVNGL